MTEKAAVSERGVKDLGKQVELSTVRLRSGIDELHGLGEKAVVKQPVLSLGVAFIFGLALGAVLTRSRK